MSDQCPKCGAESKKWKTMDGQMYECDTWRPLIGDLDQSKECRIRELVAENERLRIDSENYRGKCDVCGVANMDMLTDEYCAACEVERLRADAKRLEWVHDFLDLFAYLPPVDTDDFRSAIDAAMKGGA